MKSTNFFCAMLGALATTATEAAADPLPVDSGQWPTVLGDAEAPVFPPRAKSISVTSNFFLALDALVRVA